MTREEAKAYGEKWISDIDSLCDNDKRDLDEEDEEMYEFLKAAVSALQQEPCGDAISRQDVVKAVDKHTNDDGTLDDDITCILEDVPSVTPQPCEDAISRQAVLNVIAANCIRENEYNLTLSKIMDAVEQLSSVSTEKTDDYKQGWHDAIEKALKEAYTIHHYGDIFRVVQEETLIGVGMTYEQEPQESEE